eukprot:Amastigsp_a969_33.p3 type:complete len:138 gc:universal Amastigsp_a969_33:1-414(+)
MGSGAASPRCARHRVTAHSPFSFSAGAGASRRTRSSCFWAPAALGRALSATWTAVSARGAQRSTRSFPRFDPCAWPSRRCLHLWSRHAARVLTMYAMTTSTACCENALSWSCVDVTWSPSRRFRRVQQTTAARMPSR